MTITSSTYNTGGNCLVQDIRLEHDGRIRYIIASEEGIAEYNCDIFEDYDSDHAASHEVWYTAYDSETALRTIEDHCGAYTAAVLYEAAKLYEADEVPPTMRIEFGKSTILVALNHKTFMMVFEPNSKDALICEIDSSKTLLQHLMFADFHSAQVTDWTDWRYNIIDDILFDKFAGR